MRYVSLNSSFLMQRLLIASVCFFANTSQPAFGADPVPRDPSIVPHTLEDPHQPSLDNPHPQEQSDPNHPNANLTLQGDYVQTTQGHVAINNSADKMQEADDAEENIDTFINGAGASELTNNDIAKMCKAAIDANFHLVRLTDPITGLPIPGEPAITRCEFNYRSARDIAKWYKIAGEKAHEIAMERAKKQQQQGLCRDEAFNLQLQEQNYTGARNGFLAFQTSYKQTQIMQQQDANALSETGTATVNQGACMAAGLEAARDAQAIHQSLHATALDAESHAGTLVEDGN